LFSEALARALWARMLEAPLVLPCQTAGEESRPVRLPFRVAGEKTAVPAGLAKAENRGNLSVKIFGWSGGHPGPARRMTDTS